MSIERTFDLIINAGTSSPLIINANQNDSGEIWKFNLYQEDGTKVIPAAGEIVGLKTDGHAIVNAGTVNASGQVVITETAQITAAVGANVFEIVFDSVHGTANFILYVEKSPVDDDADFSESDISAIQQAIAMAIDSATVQGIERKQELLQTEFDQLIAPTGEAPNPAEITNARIGADGTVYDTLGNAIRGQVSDLNEIVNKVYETNALYNKDTKIVSGEGTYVFENIYEITDVSEGDIYTMSIGSVTGNLWSNVGYIDAYDSSNTRTRREVLATNTSLTQSITVASGEVKLVFVLYPSSSGATTATYRDVKIYEGTTVYEQINPDLLTADEVSDVIGDISEARTQNDFLTYEYSDRFDPEDATLEVYIDPDTGTERSNSGYYTTDFMPIREGETLYFLAQGTRTAVQARFYACYDKNKNYISQSGGSYATSVNQSGNIAYVRASFGYNTAYFIATPESLAVLPTNKAFFLPWTATEPVFTDRYSRRKTVYIYATDTEQQVIDKLVSAYKTGNTDVQFERAVYNFGTVLPTVKTLYGLNENEIPIGNNCRYFFNGATLKAEIDLSTLGTDFYCNLLGSQRFPSSYELYDGILISTDTRYVVHDESSGYDATYRRVYRNMQMEYITNARTETIRKCIGGGTGKNGVIDIEGCKFTTDGTDPAVSFHGNGSDVPDSKFYINARNNWFSNNFTIYAFNPEYQTGKLFFTGNSTDNDISSVTGWDITSFGNEIRN